LVSALEGFWWTGTSCGRVGAVHRIKSRCGSNVRSWRKRTLDAASGGLLFGDQSLFCSTIQNVSERQEKVAPEIVRGFAGRILEPVITCVIRKKAVLEFAVAILNNFRTRFPEEIRQRLGFVRAAEINDDGTVAFHGVRTDCFLHAVVDAGYYELLLANFRVAWGRDQNQTDDEYLRT
jgi:hypothetical protein